MKLKKLALLAAFLSLNCVINMFYIEVAPNLRIYFTFIIDMLVACLFNYGTVVLYAIIEDILSFLIMPSGMFFPGYTLTAVVSMSIYWLFLHKNQKIYKIALAKFSVNIIANVLLNSVWTYFIYNMNNRGYFAIILTSLIKNMILLPIEIGIFIIVLLALRKPLQKFIGNEKKIEPLK